MSPINKYPAWAEPSSANALEEAVDDLIIDYSEGLYVSLDRVATEVLDSVYNKVVSAVERDRERRLVDAITKH